MSDHRVMDIVIPDGSAYIAMVVAFVAYFVFSFLWWGLAFGKKWAVEMGFDPEERQPMALPMVLNALGTVALVYVLWHVMFAFVAMVDGGDLMMGEMTYSAALQGAFYTWLGFFMPVQLGRVAWEKASWTLFGINAGGHLVGLAVIGLVFVWM